MISMAGEYIRLHRPWLRELLCLLDWSYRRWLPLSLSNVVLSSQNKAFQYSRDQAIKYSKLLLAVYRSPSCNKQKWGGLSYKATNAAIVLAIDILAFPEQSEVDLLRSMVKAVQKQMEAQAPHSVRFVSVVSLRSVAYRWCTSQSLCRKGSRLIGFLLDKDAALTAARDQRRQQKRSRVDTSDVSSFPSRSLRTVFDSTLVGEPIFLHERDNDVEALHHKTDISPTGSEDFSAPSSSSYSHPPRTIAPTPSHADFRPPPPPIQRTQHAAPAPSVNSLIDGVNFADFAGAFEFDFNMPNHPFPSPAPTNDYSSQSPYLYPPSYQSTTHYPSSSSSAYPTNSSLQNALSSYGGDHKSSPLYQPDPSLQPYYR